jgi:hypothetical protein
MNIGRSLGEIVAALEVKKRAEEAISRHWTNMLPTLRTICLEAVNTFNETQPPDGLKIHVNSFAVEVGFEEKTLSITTMLRQANGDQPEDNFDLGDPERLIGARFGGILNDLLRKKGIPLVFGEVKVPEFYYMKL